MTQSKEVKPNGEAIVLIPLQELKSSPLNSRKDFDSGKIAELAKNIKDVGLIQPLTVRMKDGSFEIVAGERRFRALKIVAGVDESFKSVKCIVEEFTDEEAEAVQLAENIHREDLSSMEECEAYNKLFQHHKTIKRVSEIADLEAAKKRAKEKEKKASPKTKPLPLNEDYKTSKTKKAVKK